MLGKLFKHEMKAMARLLLPLYLVLAALTVVNRIVIYLDIFKGSLEVIPGFIAFAYGMSIIAIIVVSAVIIILRFYKNLMTDEGYLMFTLPVKTHELINSKLLASMLWTVASIVGVITSLLILASGSADFSEIWPALKEAMAMLKATFGSYLTLFIIEIITMFILSMINSVLIVYVSIALGQLFNGHKIIGSFLSYISINVVLQVLTTIASIIAGLVFTEPLNDILSLPQIVLPIGILSVLILDIVYYWATDFLFKRKLNLD